MGEEAIRIAEATNRPTLLVLALRALGVLLVNKGDLERAIPLLERGIAVSRAFEIALGFSGALGGLARAYALAGRVAEAIPLAEQAINESTIPAAGLLAAAEIYVLAGRLGEAYAMLEQALALARKRAERPGQAQALALLGRIAAHRDPPEVEEAEARYREALDLAEALGMGPVMARVHLHLGALYQRASRRGLAREHLTIATTMCSEMDMQLWLEQAQAELKELN